MLVTVKIFKHFLIHKYLPVCKICGGAWNSFPIPCPVKTSQTLNPVPLTTELEERGRVNLIILYLPVNDPRFCRGLTALIPYESSKCTLSEKLLLPITNQLYFLTSYWITDISINLGFPQLKFVTPFPIYEQSPAEIHVKKPRRTAHEFYFMEYFTATE